MNIISGGSDAFLALSAPNYFMPNIDTSVFRDKLTTAGQSIFDTHSKIVETTRASVNKVKNIINRLASSGQHIHPNMIYTINNVDAIHTANIAMQRWIMANPYLKKDFFRGETLFDGYEAVGKGVGEEDYDYRRVTNGIVMSGDKGLHVTEHIEDIHHDSDLLSFEDQDTILATHEFIDSCLQDEDFNIYDIKSDTVTWY